MNTQNILKISIIFLLGFLSANLVGAYLIYGFEMPASFNYLGFSLGNGNNGDYTPFDFINENQIKVYDNRIVIYVDDASIGRYAPTGSMKPVLDEGSNGIRIKPKSEKDIHLGDVITFRDEGYLIIHRVVDIGTDDKGVYFITKGDNNSVSDGKVRFKDIRYLTIGVIW